MGESCPPWPGRLDDRFAFQCKVGAGASAQVYRAFDHLSGKKVALKILHDTQGEQRFLREIQLLASLNSPYFARYIYHGKLPSGQAYAAMEWLEGKDLGAWFEGHALSLAQAAEIVLDVTLGLACLHEHKIVHRDIKPTNIFLLDTPGKPQPKILDLGVATYGGGQRNEQETGLVGTPAYMSPELASMEAVSISSASDVYSLCAVYYELLTGRRPHEHGHLPMLLANILHEPITRPSVFNREVPPSLDALIMKGLHRNPSERFPDGSAMVQALTALIKSNYEDQPSDLPAPGNVVDGLPDTPDEPRTVALLMMKTTSGEIARLGEPGAKESISQIINNFGGRLFYLPGGVMLGIFGEGKTLGDEVSRSLKAGLQTQRLFYLSAAVILGKFGGEYRLQPALALATRLLEQPGTTEGIRVDGNTVRRARSEFSVVRKKGYSVVPGTVEWSERTEPDLVGRGREQALLLSFLHATARESKPQIILLVGDNGMGKSSLCTWFFRKAEEEGFQIYPAVAHSEMADKPYALIERLLAARAGIAQDLHPHIRKTMIEAFAARHPNHDQALRFLLGMNPHVPGMSEEAVRWSIWEAVSDVVESDLASAPLLWMVDDFHHVDAMSSNLISWLLASARGGLGLVITTSPDQLNRLRTRLPVDVKLDIHVLSPLSRADARTLVGRNTQDPDQEEIAAIVNRGDGNPLFLEELSLLYRRGTNERAVTRNIQITAQMALDRLEPNTSRVARTAAILGERGTLNALSAMLDNHDLNQARNDLEESGIWRAYPLGHEREKYGWRFKHTITRDAVYQLLPSESRTRGHEAAACYYDDERHRDTRKAARHYLAAGNKEQAARCLLTMAREAHDAADIETTLHLVQKVQKMGLSGIYKQEVLYLRAAAHTWLGRLALALDDVRQLLAQEDGVPYFRARAACLGCLQVRRLADSSEGLAMAELAVKHGQESGDMALLATCYYHAAIVHYDAGDNRAITLCLQALEDMKSGDERVTCYKVELEFMVAIVGQKFEEAMTHGKLALQYNRKLGNYPQLGANVGNAGTCLRHLGRFREALSYAAMSRTIYKRQGNRLHRYDAAMNEGRLLGHLGRFEEALASLNEAMQGLLKAGEVHRTAVVGALIARVLARRGEPADFKRARKLVREHLHDDNQAFLHALETLLAGMDVYQRCEEKHKAAATAERCLLLLDSQGGNNQFACEALSLAAICLEDVNHPRAVETVVRAAEGLKQLLAGCKEPSSSSGITVQIRAHRLFLERHPTEA